MNAGPTEAIGPSERWQFPSARLRLMRRAETVAATLAAAAAGCTLAAIIAGAETAAIVAAGVIIAGVLADRVVRRRVKSWAYCEREDDLLVRRGVLVQRLSVIPYGRMQFVDVIAGPIERSFGLATVRMHTAAAATDARIPGLGEQDAARLRDQLAKLGEATAAGL